MSVFSKLREILHGIHVFPQPKHSRRSARTSNDGAQSLLRAEDGYVPARRVYSGRYRRLWGFVFVAMMVALSAGAQTGGRISGSVKDPSGAVIPGSQVILLNPATDVRQSAVTDASGEFNFPVVPVGQYELDVTATGFTPYKQTQNLNVDVKTSLNVDVVLQLAETSQTVTVTTNTAEVQTSDTQIGQTIESKQVESVPLNGRSYTDLLAVQAGVTPVTTSGATNSSSGGGFGTVPAGGEANTGQFSIHGQRESDNAYFLNGVSVQETIGQQAGIIPNLDSIAEFRILSSNVDAEYGGFTGGIINVVTKSGSNSLHGNVFEFFRNTNLDARNYFSPERAAFHQNQYGGTLGGPIEKNKIFFFADYQGQRYVQGIVTGITPVPSLANRTGDFTDSAAFSGRVNGPYLAQLLSARLGRPVTVGEPFSQVFPGNVVPQSAWGPPATHLMQYIPVPN
ncbi:MAG: carboxypeptidase regulatory-like domain-containing protein, partial [Silvibacterium sp.]|nr:carboxypeptidase regulatory-like domain-containing protein [Silvibacterium sp.]